MSVSFQTKWLWVWIPLLSLKLQIWHMFWLRSSLTFSVPFKSQSTMLKIRANIHTTSKYIDRMMSHIFGPYFSVLGLNTEIYIYICYDWYSPKVFSCNRICGIRYFLSLNLCQSIKIFWKRVTRKRITEGLSKLLLVSFL